MKGRYGKINKKFKSQWVKALESKKFEQTCDALKNETGYCCLGVACEISNAGKFGKVNSYAGDFVFQLPEFEPDEYYERNEEEKIASSFLVPANLSRKLKLTKRAQNRLMKMNDGGMSFAEIAQWIRKYL